MKNIFKKFSLILLILGLFLGFGWVNTHPLYTEYAKLFDYRRSHPDFIPTAEFMKISSAGHSNTRADMTWITMIQYIGDNIGNQKYLEFAPTILDRIHAVHPYFMKPYEIHLLLLPTFSYQDTEEMSREKEKAAKKNLKDIEQYRGYWCQEEFLTRIARLDSDYQKLWTDPLYQRPCRDGNIPYHMAFHYYNTLGDTTRAKEYYKIAAAQTRDTEYEDGDAPSASRYLISMMDGKSGKYLPSALSFLSLAATGEDDELQSCISAVSAATQIVDHAINHELTDRHVRDLDSIEQTLLSQTGTVTPQKNALAVNCRDYYTRAMRQVSYAFVESQAQKMKAATGEDPQQEEALKSKGYLSLYPRLGLKTDAPEGAAFVKNPKTKSWEYTIYTYEDTLGSWKPQKMEGK